MAIRVILSDIVRVKGVGHGHRERRYGAKHEWWR